MSRGTPGKGVCALIDVGTRLFQTGAAREWTHFQEQMRSRGYDLEDATAQALWQKAVDNHATGRNAEELKLADLRRIQARNAERLRETTAAEFASGLYKAGLLSVVRTPQASVVGNAVSLLADGASRVPAALVDRLLKVGTGQRTVALGQSGQWANAGTVRQAADEMWETLVHGASRTDVARMDVKKVDYKPFKEGSVLNYGTRALSWIVNKEMDLISAADKPARVIAWKSAFREAAVLQAMREGLTGDAVARRATELMSGAVDPETAIAAMASMSGGDEAVLKEMIAFADTEEEITILANPNLMSGAIGRLRKGAADAAPGGELAVDAVIPFVKIPTNAVLRAIEYGTPLGALWGGQQGVRAILEAKKGNLETSARLQRRAAVTLGRNVTGMGLMYLGWVLADHLTDPESTDEGLRETRTAAGEQGGSVKVGDRYYSMRDMPQFWPLLIGARIRHDQEYAMQMQAEASSPVSKYLEGTLQSTAEQSLDLPTAKFAKDVTYALQEAARGGQGVVQGITKRYGSSVIPSEITDLGQIGRTERIAADTFKERLKADTPVVNKDMPVQTDALGRPYRRQDLVVRGLSVADREKQDDPVAQELKRLRISNVPPDGPDGLTTAQRQEFRAFSGEVVRRVVQQYLDNEAYATLSESDKRDVLADAKRDARTMAMKAWKNGARGLK